MILRIKQIEMGQNPKNRIMENLSLFGRGRRNLMMLIYTGNSKMTMEDKFLLNFRARIAQTISPIT